MNLLRTVVWCLVLAVGHGCGIDAEDQSGRRLKPPTLPKDSQSFFLQNGAYEKTFSGSLIAWQDDADPEGLAAVAEVSNEIIRNGVATLKYIKSEIAPLKQEFDSLYARVAPKKVKLATDAYSMAVQAAAVWFAGADGTGGQLAEIAAEYKTLTEDDLSPAARGQAMNWMISYCEAKLWERAVDKTFINEQYRGRRPTPSAMCEGVYQQMNLLSDQTPACAASSAYKNYFACLWHEGVLKTSLWQRRYGQEPRETAQAFAEFSDTALMYNFSERNLGVDLLAQQGATLVVDPVTGKEANVDLTFVKGPDGPSALSVANIIDNIERSAQPGDAYQIIPGGAAEGPAGDYIAAKNAWLREQLTLFNKLAKGNYVNENRFNRLFQQDSPVKQQIKWTTAKQGEAAKAFPSIFGVTTPELQALYAEVQTLEAQIMLNAQKAQAKFAPLAPRDDCPPLPKTFDPSEPLDGSYSCLKAGLTKKATGVSAPEDVSQAIWQGLIKFKRDAEGKTLQVWVTPNVVSGRPHYGCAELIEGGDNCPGAPSDGFGEAGISIDETTGYFKIWVELDDPEKSGLGPSQRSQFEKQLSFSEVPLKKLRNNRLTFFATLNDIDGVLTTFLGDAAVKDQEGQVTVPSSVKMRDAHPYYQVLAEDYQRSLLALQAQISQQ